MKFAHFISLSIFATEWFIMSGEACAASGWKKALLRAVVLSIAFIGNFLWREVL